MSASKVIVFGPTGNVGAITAVTASQLGAKVYLAMRDTSKSISDISAADEKSGKYERVQADLTKPDTIVAAVKSSGAKRAFIYLAHGTPDHMKASIEALKEGGVEFVVFLSSCSVEGDPADATPEKIIPFLHAQVELSLKAVFGSKGYAAVRPGGFATNAQTWYREGLKAGEVEMFAPDFDLDWITPEDMGGVSGAILVNGLKSDNPVVLILGPQKLSQKQAFQIVVEAIKRDVKLTIVDKEAAKQQLAKNGIPPPIAQYLADEMEKFSSPESKYIPDESYKQGVENVVTYTGKPGLKFVDWVPKNKGLFV